MQYMEIDSKINWIEFYKRHLKNTKRSGNDKISALCPFHHDHHNSFWFNTKNGCYKCEACGETGNGIVFLEKIEHIDSKEAYKRLLKEAGEYREKEYKQSKYTLEDYCNAKHLPASFVSGLGVKNAKTGISIPYFDEKGQVIAERYRSLQRKFSWKKGSSLCLYGLWLLERAREAKYVVLVEGESDSHTLWLHKIPALGVPGSSTFKGEWADYLTGIYTRVLEVYGSPFDSESSAREVHNISSKVYGHAGCEFIKRLMRELEIERNLLKDMYGEILNHLLKGHHDKLGSHLTAASVVAIADKLISKWIFNDEDKAVEMVEIIMESLEGKVEADITGRAYEFIRNWVISNNIQFTDDAKSPRYGYSDEDTYYIFPHIRQDALSKQDYPYKKVVRAMGDRELIGISYEGDKKRYQVSKRFGDKVARFIEFKFYQIKESPPF